MLSEEQMKEYDFEKLRKRIISRQMLAGFLTGLFSDVATCNNAYNATPEQLTTEKQLTGAGQELFCSCVYPFLAK